MVRMQDSLLTGLWAFPGNCSTDTPPHQPMELCDPLQVPVPSPLPPLGSRQGTHTLYKPHLCGDRPSLAPLPAGVFPPELVSVISPKRFGVTCSRGAFRARFMRHACCDHAVCTHTNTHAHTCTYTHACPHICAHTPCTQYTCTPIHALAWGPRVVRSHRRPLR